ncbi:G-box-binding factor 2-like isoform X2 [Impatiens glandulifera]|uniref:G-box-binding factor 2-like isoform X2 n=1 Tax=Impatiens glandulifera TaxID=253017 RepID=UPI001FB0677B|nr:G-box-binding factor 2-like isoform X2 [Impatiens glandulifera]
MGSDEEIGSPNKSDKPSSSTTQEQSNSPLNPEWANVQAYYGPGIPMQPPPPPYMNCAVMPGHSPYHPHMWAPPPQAMMAHYGMPYSSMYSPHGIVYAHPAVPLVAVDGQQQQQTNNNKPSDCGDKTPQTIKKRRASNDKVEFDGQGSAHSRREHGIDDASSNDSDNNTPYTQATSSFPEEEEVGNNNNNNNARVVDGSQFLVESRQSKREKRKQANRESARRSRLRKQSETEELMETYESLKMENISLKSEMNQLIDQSDKLRLENQVLSLREEQLNNNNNNKNRQAAEEETEETRNTSLLLLTQSDQGTAESKKLNFKRKKTKSVVVVG